MVDYYDVLGVSASATQHEIKLAYKHKAKLFHPDSQFGGAHTEEQFKLINEAYQVLSNATSRSHHDLQRVYAAYQQSQRNVSHAHYAPPFRPRPRPFYKAVKVDSRENLMATLYAFIVTFGIGIVVFAGLWYFKSQEEKVRNAMLAERREQYLKAVAMKGSGDIFSALTILTDLGYFYPEEKEIYDFKKQVFEELEKTAETSLRRREYHVSVEAYETLFRFTNRHSTDMLLNMATAYEGNQEYERAIQFYTKVKNQGMESLGLYFKMGQLYEEGLGNYEKALECYQICAKKAVVEYESSIGLAYPLVINAAMIPEEHYWVFQNLSEMYYQLGYYDEAIMSLAWSKEIWKDSLALMDLEQKSIKALNRVD